MQAIREACKRLGTPHLKGCVLYTSAGESFQSQTAVGMASRHPNLPFPAAATQCMPHPPAAEPCPMCCCACMWARLDKVYYAATHADAKQFGR